MASPCPSAAPDPPTTSTPDGNGGWIRAMGDEGGEWEGGGGDLSIFFPLNLLPHRGFFYFRPSTEEIGREPSTYSGVWAAPSASSRREPSTYSGVWAAPSAQSRREPSTYSGVWAAPSAPSWREPSTYSGVWASPSAQSWHSGPQLGARVNYSRSASCSHGVRLHHTSVAKGMVDTRRPPTSIYNPYTSP